MPDLRNDCPLAARLADLLRDAREELVSRWLERIVARVSIEPERVFPTDELLDHVPLLIDGIADYIEDPVHEITADVPVVAKAMELGDLRHRQGFDAYQILKEYEILGGILFTHLTEMVETLDEPCTQSELLACGHRLFRAIALIQQATTTHFLRLGDKQVNEREERLRAFNRALSHELKNRIGAVLGATELLESDMHLEEALRQRLLGVIGDNTREMNGVLNNLLELSRLEGDARKQKHVKLPGAVAEAARQLRGMSSARGVQVRIDPQLPAVEVNAAAIELCLGNYLSNAIKYADPQKPERWVHISAALRNLQENGECELIVRVEDNGLGVPRELRSSLFQRFFRAHEGVTGVEGTGLGLSIVRDTIESIGGRAWAEFPEEGSVFALAAPCRRGADTGAPDDRRAAAE